MSLLTPERVPVKVYRWDDDGAPALDKTAGCMMTIFKACLVTGYGTKEGAGWTMPWEDPAAGVKVLRPDFGPHTDFYLRLSADTGQKLTPQVYLNMTDANTGALKLQCDSNFSYAQNNSTGKWLLIATPRSFWFFSEQGYSTPADKLGSYIFCGDIRNGGSSERAVYLQHTASYYSALYSSIFGIYFKAVKKDSTHYNYGKLMRGSDNAVSTTDITSIANGYTLVTKDDFVTGGFIFVNQELYILPGLYAPLSGAQYNNFTETNFFDGFRLVPALVFGTGSRDDTNIYISTDYWVY